MKYAEYKLMTEHTEIDQTLYRKLLKDAATSSPERFNAILHIFISLNVPENFDGDVQEIWNEGLAEIEENNYSEELREVVEYAAMIWALTPDLSDSVYNTLEQIDA